MPSIPILVLRRANIGPREVDYSSNSSGRVELSPTALGFLLPLFILFIFGPIACVFLIRRHRRNWRARHLFVAISPAERREDARKRLEDVTNVTKGTEAKYACQGVTEGEKGVDTVSILERDCSICLSSLHAPSPPEPAKVSAESSQVDEAARAPSVSEKSLSEQEEILRLKVCNHEFHAECLISWFVIGKYSCPICRAVYYGKKQEEGEGRTGSEAGNRRTRQEV